MKQPRLSRVESFQVDLGWTLLCVWRDGDGWRQSGPASLGPRDVRKSGRGPCWAGPVPERHVRQLLRLLPAEDLRPQITLKPVQMTKAEAKRTIRALGCCVSVSATGEWRVAPRELRGAAREEAAYYTADMDDAVATAKAMAAQR